MTFYFAPMEGITGYVYRNAHHRYFGGIDGYYTPFIVPTQTRKLSARESQDILPEHNAGIRVVPQVLASRADNFCWAAEVICRLGYQEVNLNLGCPSGTVVSKRRGAGFLSHPQELDAFLDAVSGKMEKLGMKLSIKTRIGLENPDAFPRLLEIFNQYPVEMLIVHPRVGFDYYKNRPNLEAFQMALAVSRHRVCYNGDLFTSGALGVFQERYPQAKAVMAGRGLIANPALAQAARGGKSLEKGVLQAFHDELYAGYRETLSGDKSILNKMKELWYYMGNSFQNYEKYGKRIKKARHMPEYEAIVGMVFADLALVEEPGFYGEVQSFA